MISFKESVKKDIPLLVTVAILIYINGLARLGRQENKS